MLQLEMEDLVYFGPLPEVVNAKLQQGIALYQDEPATAERLFREALAISATALPAWFCLIKLHNRYRQFDAAHEAALGALAEASRQCNLSADWQQWHPEHFTRRNESPWSHTLRALKALAFIELRRGGRALSIALVDKLRELDPEDGVGYSVVDSLLEATA
ncbi:hypothetical protein DLREEDagrD3_17280 [Denitratisoma sp. agr-D3]